MVKIRLRRVGAKKQPSYRVVVADSRAPRDGRFIETIGHYDPRTEPPTVVIHEDRALYWLSVGAQPSDPVARFFQQLGLSDKLKEVRGGAAIEDVATSPEAAAAAKAEAAKKKPAKAVEEKAAPEAPAEEAPAGADEAPSETAAEQAEVVGAAPVEEAPVEEAPVQEAPAEEPAKAKGKPEAPAAAAATDLDVASLELSTRVAKALDAEGITSAAQLVERLAAGDDALLAIPGIGEKAVDEIRAKLADHGLIGS